MSRSTIFLAALKLCGQVDLSARLLDDIRGHPKSKDRSMINLSREFQMGLLHDVGLLEVLRSRTLRGFFWRGIMRWQDARLNQTIRTLDLAVNKEGHDRD